MFREGRAPAVLVARNGGKLDALAASLATAHGVKVWVQPTDLAQPGAAQAFAAALRRMRIEIDVLVNNAGVPDQGPFATMPAGRHQELIDLNVSGLTAMLAEFLPPMVNAATGACST